MEAGWTGAKAEAEAEATPESAEDYDDLLGFQGEGAAQAEQEELGLPEEEHLAALERAALERKRELYIAEELEDNAT